MRSGFFLVAAFLIACPAFAAARDEWADENKDGRKEAHLFYEGAKVVRAEADVNGDGTIDRWVKYLNGKRFAAESDSDQDGRMDRWDFYTTEGEIGRTAKDTDADGAPDKFTTLLNGLQTVIKEQDRNHDGKIDRRSLCEWTAIKRPGAPTVPGHKPLWTEQDDDFNGKIDKYTDKKNPAASKAKIGKPMDGCLTPFPGAPSTAAAQPLGMPAEGVLPKASEGPRPARDMQNVDRMNARYGLDSVDWDKEDK